MTGGMNSQVAHQEDFYGVYSVFAFSSLFLNAGRQSLPNIVAVTILSGTVLGIFAWAGGMGGFSQFAGVDLHQALEYRRKWRFYPTNKIPLEDYERAIGRRVYPEDFADINAIFGEGGPPIDDPTDVVGILPVRAPSQQWWKEILEKARTEEKKDKK